jgi:uncharacterized protein with FMN-binding domain
MHTCSTLRNSLSQSLVILAMSVLVAGCSPSEVQPSPTVPTTDEAGSSTSEAASSAPKATQSEAATVPSRKYKNGTFSGVGHYISPAGPEEIHISLTLKDDVIADATFIAESKNPKSQNYQKLFSEGFKVQVVGKSIDSLSLTVVNGSSLTPKGFMDAVEAIQVEAKA